MPKQAKWKEFTKEQLEEIVKNSISNREVAEKLGYSPDGGGTMQALRKMYQELEIDISHFKGQGWKKEKYDYSSFKSNSYKKRGQSTLNPLIYLRGRKCECCQNTEWLGKPINLEIHQALKYLDLTPAGGNYDRARKLIDEYDIEHLKK